MLDGAIDGLLLVLSWPTFGFIMFGILLGLFLGAVPGIGGIAGIVILLPFTFTMDPVAAIALLLTIAAVGATGDTLTAVLLGVPGGPSAVVLDGYPMAKQGQADRALGAAYASSAYGGVFGGVVLAISIPIVGPLLLAVGAPELFMLGILGLTLVGTLSGKAMMKGLIGACIGLLIAMIGYGSTVAIPRYWFDWNFLLEGVPLVPVVMGLFAVPEIMELAIKNRTIADAATQKSEPGGMWRGIVDATRHWWLVIKSSLIGVYIGIVPGVGGSIVDWIAYGAAVQGAKDKSKFGKGDVRGVIAPEAANNSVRGGSLIPVVAFGVPGSIYASLLLGAMLIHGITPGRTMLEEQLDITFSMVWTLILANIIAALIMIFASRYLAKVVFISGHKIVAVVLVLIFMGAWMTTTDIGDWITLLVFSVLGIWLKLAGWPRPPVILGFVLGPIMEANFHLSTRTYDYAWLMRPIVIGLGIVIALALAMAIWRRIKDHRAGELTDMGEGQPVFVFSLPFSIVMLVIFTGAIVLSLNWPASVRSFPIFVSGIAVAMLLATVVGDIRGFRANAEAAGGAGPAISSASREALIPASALFMLMLVGLMLASMVFGQLFVLTLFPLLYLRFWGETSWRFAIIYAALVFAFLYIIYERMLHVFWYPALVPNWLGW